MKAGRLWNWLDAWLLQLEAQGWIFYRHRQPTGGGLGALIELQKALEPGVRQVEEVPQHADRRIFPGDDPGDPGLLRGDARLPG